MANTSETGGRWGPLSAEGGARGVVLLEVVISLSILLMAMGVIGLVFNNGQHYLEISERRTRAMLLTERLIAEMDTGYMKLEEQEQSGFFGVEGEPGMSWRVEVNPDDTVQGLLNVRIHIYMGDPDGPEEERLRILTTHVFRAEPKGLDLERDFGIDLEQLASGDAGGTFVAGGGGAADGGTDSGSDASAGAGGLADLLSSLGLDPTNFDPRILAQQDLDTLVEILPTLFQSLGLSMGGGQLNQLMGAAAGGNMNGLQNLGIPGGGAPNGNAGPPGRGGGGDRPGRRTGGRSDRGGGAPNANNGNAGPPRRGGGDQGDGSGRGGPGRQQGTQGRGSEGGPSDRADDGSTGRRPSIRPRRGGGRG